MNQYLPTQSHTSLPVRAPAASLVAVVAALCVAGLNPTLFANDTPSATPRPLVEHYVPLDQLDAVFDQSAGILLPRVRYQELVDLAEAAARSTADAPVAIAVRSAHYQIQQQGHRAILTATLDLEQFHQQWQTLTIPVQNLSLESASVDENPASIARSSASQLTLFHDQPGRFTVRLTFSTPLGQTGSDRVLRFGLQPQVAARLSIDCPAGHHLLLDGKRLQRPTAVDQAAEYQLPAGNRTEVQLRWTTEQQDNHHNKLVFAQSTLQLQLTDRTVSWEGRTRLNISGGTINRLVALVPSRLEITGVESTGLESWTLNDTPGNSGLTEITLTWRQPFTDDRLIRWTGIAATDSDSETLPTLQLPSVTAHSGRVVLSHHDQVRLQVNASGGIQQRTIPRQEDSTPNRYLFEYWQQDYQLQVRRAPRIQELTAQVVHHLQIQHSQTTLSARVSVRTRHESLFDVSVQLPDGWQLLEVKAQNPIVHGAHVPDLPWRTTEHPNQIIISPLHPVAVDSVFQCRLELRRTLPDLSSNPTVAVPFIQIPEANGTTGEWSLQSAVDLLVSPTELSGLIPMDAPPGQLAWESVGSAVSGKLQIQHRRVRLSARSEIRCFMDERTRTTSLQTTIDVMNSSTRTLSIRLPESAGTDLRFRVTGIAPVPGLENHLMGSLIPPQLQITETNPLPPEHGQRIWQLTFDRRFAGSVTLQTRIQQPRDGSTLSAPRVEVPGAVHQEGLIAFEADPVQQLDITADQSLRGLRPADPGLVPPPAAGTGRRIARVYQFAQPDYQVTLQESRFETHTVPSAVCRLVDNVSQLTEDGIVHRSATIHLASSGVQTLRFALPESEDTQLWSTLLNGTPVEVRHDQQDYLVALPTDSDHTDHQLQILFQTRQTTAAYAAVSQAPVKVSIDTEHNQAVPVEVLQQTWQMQYPSDSLLLSHSGSFYPESNLDQAGWLEQTLHRLPRRLNSPLSARIGLGIVLVLLTLLAVQVTHGMSSGWTTRQVTLCSLSVIVLGIVAGISSASLRGVMARRDDTSYTTLNSMAGSAASDAPLSETDVRPGRFPSFAPPASESPQGLDPLDTIEEFRAFEGEASEEESPRLSQQAAPAPPAKPHQAGTARLSVRVRMETPSEFRTTRFRSLGHSPSDQLSIVLCTTRQLQSLRLLAGLLALFLCWRVRRRSWATRLGWMSFLLLTALAVVPLVRNAWQPVVDGVFLGSCTALLIWPLAAMLTWLQNLSLRRAAVGATLLLAVLTGEITQADQPQTTATESAADTQPASAAEATQTPTEVIVPYVDDQPPLTASRVFVPQARFLQLYRQAHPDQLPPDNVDHATIIAGCWLDSGPLTPIDDNRGVQSFRGRLLIRQFTSTPTDVRLPLSGVALRSVTVNEQAAVVQAQDDGWTVHIARPGLHVVDLELDVGVTTTGDSGLFRLPVTATVGSLTWQLPTADAEVKVNGRSDTFRRQNTTITVPLTGTNVDLSWNTSARRSHTDVTIHGSAVSALELDDSGLVLSSALKFTVRQGTLSEQEIDLPENYRIRQLQGDNIAGWSVLSDQQPQRLQLRFREPVTDSSQIQLTLFAPWNLIAGTPQDLTVPVLHPLKVTRSTGTVCVLADHRLDVQTMRLSGVSQINPDQAPRPSQANPERESLLAWKYHRQPLEIGVRVTRKSREVRALHDHQVELLDEQQHWDSSITISIRNSAQRRFEFQLPADFVVDSVDGKHVRDWSTITVDGNHRLQVSLDQAHSGQVQLELLGSRPRPSATSTETLSPPQLLHLTHNEARLSVQLPQFVSIVDTTGDNWTITTNTAGPSDRQSSEDDPALKLRNHQLTPADVQIQLRKEQPSAICESVLVTSVTPTSLERTLALSWQITRSAADRFSVVLPQELADTLDFHIPGLRREERTAAENNQIRITFYLRVPVDEKFFAAGMGSVPLPASGQMTGIPVAFVQEDQDPRQPQISSQAHFRVLVNQSDGVLEPAESFTSERDVTAEELTTDIPQAWLQQAVAIRRVLEPSHPRPWQIRFPEIRETAPAVIVLAHHITVLADDGSWRSLHTLQVRNTSHQFLPVRLPGDSRPLFCTVQGRPTRIVTDGNGDSVLALIPIPPSGEISVPYEVRLALAGHLPQGTATAQNQWQADSLTVPIPEFPEYRNDRDRGVTVARNTWSVYVPQAWSSSVDTSPEHTNVVPASEQAMSDLSTQAIIANCQTLLTQSDKHTSRLARQQLVNQLSLQLQQLEPTEIRGRKLGAELDSTRQQVREFLSSNADDGIVLDLSGVDSKVPGNWRLNERALTRNNFNDLNFGSIISGNTISGNGAEGLSLRFKGKSKRSRQNKTGSGFGSGRRSGGIGGGGRPPEDRFRVGSGAWLPPESDAPAGVTGNAVAGPELFAIPQPNQRDQNFSRSRSENMNADRTSGEQNQAAQAGATTPPPATGLLSLKFDIPTDGQRFDFVRSGGNASLALQVHTAEWEQQKRGLLQAAACCLLFLVMVRILNQKSDTGSRTFRRLTVLTACGLVAWLLLSPPWALAGFLLGITGLLLHLCLAASVRTADQIR